MPQHKNPHREWENLLQEKQAERQKGVDKSELSWAETLQEAAKRCPDTGGPHSLR